MTVIKCVCRFSSEEVNYMDSLKYFLKKFNCYYYLLVITYRVNQSQIIIMKCTVKASNILFLSGFILCSEINNHFTHRYDQDFILLIYITNDDHASEE